RFLDASWGACVSGSPSSGRPSSAHDSVFNLPGSPRRESTSSTMRRSSWLSPAWAACLARLAVSLDVVYVTELQIYTLLAPCARNAVSYNVATETLMTRCGEGQNELQSCICSNTNEFRQVSKSLANAVTSSCGESATDDFWSASKIMDKYCDQAATITFSTPTANIVNAYITDLPQMSYLPGCAQSAISYAVMGAMSSYCPEDASLFAPCVCNAAKARSVSTTLSKSVRYSCSNGEDVTAANAFFDEYCAMNNGTTSFAAPARPPGDMTYHITALPQFTSLRACAQSGVSYAVLAQTNSLCGSSGPQALASCACLKSGMLSRVSSTLTSNVKFYCESTATADITSALAVLDFYCSAAENKVVATAAESIPESYPTAQSRTGAGSPNPTQTGGGGSNGKDTSGGDSSGGSGGGNRTAVIAASVLGGVIVIAIVAAAAFFLRHKRRQRARGEQIPTVAGTGEGHNGTPELDGKSDWAGRMASPGVTPSVPELSTPRHSPRPELQGGIGAAVSELSPHQSPRPELQSEMGSGYPIPPYQQQPQELVSPGYGYHPQAHPNGRPAYDANMVSPPSAHNGYSPGWQSGPVESYELDSNLGRRNG
ncbi:hypothetical protein TOPH_09070, partial [Tolypocladium ophioglossoides CBS 100239]